MRVPTNQHLRLLPQNNKGRMVSISSPWHRCPSLFPVVIVQGLPLSKHVFVLVERRDDPAPTSYSSPCQLFLLSLVEERASLSCVCSSTNASILILRGHSIANHFGFLLRIRPARHSMARRGRCGQHELHDARGGTALGFLRFEAGSIMVDNEEVKCFLFELLLLFFCWG